MCFFFFNDPAPTEIYTLSLHAALPISCTPAVYSAVCFFVIAPSPPPPPPPPPPPSASASAGRSRTDRKSTRLNSSHDQISYAVFCLKKKKTRYSKGSASRACPVVRPWP